MTPDKKEQFNNKDILSTHTKHELRSLEMHRIVARLFQKTPHVVINTALENISRWRRAGADCSAFAEWEDILKHKPDSLPSFLESTDEEATRLRQSSPFPGLIPENDRIRILNSFP